MSLTIGSAGANMGPRSAIESFGENAETHAFDRRIALRLLAFLNPHRARIGAALVLMVASSLLTLAIPYLIKVAIDQYISHNNAQGLASFSLLLAGCFAGIYITTAGVQYLLSWVGQKVLASLRALLFRHLQDLQLGYHDHHIIGVTISRVINDVAVINDLLSQGIVTVIGDSLVLVGIIVVMLSMSLHLALLTFLVLPLMLAATWLFAQRAQVAFRDTRARIAAVVGDLAENISAMRVIQAFSQEDLLQERFDEVNRANRDAYISAMSLSFVFLPSVEILGMLATGLVLWFGGLAVAQNELTLGVMVAFMAYVTRFFQPIQELSQIYTTMQAAMAGGERVIDLLDTAPEICDKPDAIELPRLEGRIEFRHLCFSYGGDSPVLHDIDLVVEPGRRVALVGPTGAGKTSLANLILRLYDVTAGAVLVDGFDVRDVTQRSLRRQSGLVPQDPFLFRGTIADNIRFGRPEASDHEVKRAAQLANAHDFISGLPDGYGTTILEGGVNLSLGQRQLVCIARAILADPRILVMDEATSSVDTLTEGLIQEAMERLLAGRTTVVIAHRLVTVQHADLICVLEGGRIIARGGHVELLQRCDLYRDLYERQFVNDVANI